MEALIELYNERRIENILGPETFKPKKVFYLCPKEIAQNQKIKDTINSFLASRGLKIEVNYVESSLYKADKIIKQLDKIYSENPECAIDVTGGTDAAMFAAGFFCANKNIPTFTYSRKSNHFYNIGNAPFADNIECALEYSISEFFEMAGGKLRPGRVDNKKLVFYLDKFDEFFKIFMRHRKEWGDFITFMQKISSSTKGTVPSLKIKGDWIQRDYGKKVSANINILKELVEIGFLEDLNFKFSEFVEFKFKDLQIRYWLRDAGSVLELYMYKACLDTGIFKDVISSAVVDWDLTAEHSKVSNEIDVAASKSIIPLFISCKTCDIKTDAINELAILRDRFGGKGAKAAIATTEHCNSAARHRAAQLGITVIDIDEFRNDTILDRLKVIMKEKEAIEN